jgi:hypothetical protein
MAISLPNLTLDDLSKDEEFFKGLREGGFVLVLGTGFSYGIKNRSGECPTIPLANDFAKYTARRFGTAVLDYSGAAQQWTNELDENAELFREFIDLFLVDEDEFDHKLYSSIFLPSWHNIFTLNFDNVLETIKSKTLNKKYPVRSYPHNTSADAVPNIIHLHGLLNEESAIGDIVFTKTSYREIQKKGHDLYDVLHGDVNDKKKGLVIVGTQFSEVIVLSRFFDGLKGNDIDIYHFDISNDSAKNEPDFYNRNYHFIKLEDKNGNTGTPVFLDFLHSHRDKIKNIHLEGAETINRTFIDKINSGEKFSRSKFYSAKQTDDCQWYGILNSFDVERKLHTTIKAKVFNSFSSLGAGKVAAVVSGTGGCGKSTLLRRLAIEACENTDFDVIWVKDRQLEQFVEGGLPAIQADFDNKYLVFIEDWYRLAEDNKETASSLLKTSQAMSNIRLVIGDRDTKSKDYNENLIDSANIFELRSDENRGIIKKILEGHKEWQAAGDEVLKKADALTASLFIILFVLAGIAEGRLEESEIDFSDFGNAARSIAKSDLRRIRAQYPGFAMALHYWACVYARHSMPITWETFLKIADRFNKNEEISLYFEDWKLENSVLEKLRLYLNVGQNEKLIAKYSGLNHVLFNHDKLAEDILAGVELEGWANYDDILKKILLNTITDEGDDYSASIFLTAMIRFESQLFKDNVEKKIYIDKLFYDRKNRYSHYLGALPYLELSPVELYQYIEILKNENLYPLILWSTYFKIASSQEKNKGVSAILSQEEFYKLPGSIVTTAIKISRDDAQKKKAARTILSQEEFYTLSAEIVTAAMNILRDDETGKNAASAILSQNEFYKLPHQIVSRAMKISTDDTEKTNAASTILSQNEFYKLPYQIVSTAMKISTDNTEKTDAAFTILSQNEFYKLPDSIVSTAMNISKNDTIGEKAASTILRKAELYKLPTPLVATAMRISDSENLKLSKATHYLRNWKTEDWRVVFSSLYCFSSITERPAFVTEIVDKIIDDDSDPTNREKLKYFRFANLMKIPFHNIPSWVRASELIIGDWIYESRSLIVNILLSYLSHPDKIQDMCEDILMSWEKEIVKEIRQLYGAPHFGDHIRIAMGHPDLKPHASKAARQMLERSKSKPGSIPDYLLEITKKIVEENEYPLWDLSE